jgi:hypothetical protein
MPPFDAIFPDPPRPPALRPNPRAAATTWSCGICNRVRFDPYAVAYDGAVVVASGKPVTCGLCGDGCFR